MPRTVTPSRVAWPYHPSRVKRDRRGYGWVVDNALTYSNQYGQVSR